MAHSLNDAPILKLDRAEKANPEDQPEDQQHEISPLEEGAA